MCRLNCGAVSMSRSPATCITVIGPVSTAVTDRTVVPVAVAKDIREAVMGHPSGRLVRLRRGLALARLDRLGALDRERIAEPRHRRGAVVGYLRLVLSRRASGRSEEQVGVVGVLGGVH